MAPSCRSAGKYVTFSLLLFFSCLSLPFCVAHNNPNFSYNSGFQQNDPYLNFSKNSNVDLQALQVTRLTRNIGLSDTSGRLPNSSGQVTYTQPLQLWHNSYSYSASFNTSFLLNIRPITNATGGATNNATGGGMTFLLSSHPAFPSLQNSSGQWLGLFDGSIPPHQQQAQLVAIEFDTFKDTFDPDGNHVGINVNGSIESTLAVSLSPDVTLTNASGVNTSVWIEYDGRLHILDVYLANQGPDMSNKPAKPVISHYPIDLRKYLPETIYVGFSASLGTILEAHGVLRWTFTSTHFPRDRGISSAIIIGCSIGGAAMILLVVLLVIVLVRKRRAGMPHIIEDLSSLHYGPRKFPCKELKRATKGFSKDCKLGKGGFGEVYKGLLKYNGVMTDVAVKCLSQRSRQGEREFKAEVMSMGRMRHKNLVQLLGWSYIGSSRMMLVYEYMPNGSLDKWIGQGQDGVEVMGWERRYHVMKGLAAGLLYLHEEWEMVAVHRDLKPSNVMLDAEFNARIGDFGLAKLIDFEQASTQTDNIVGTPAYMAPESREKGIISKESDIYSFGVIAIELVTGRRLFSDHFHSLLLHLENSSFHEASDPRLASFDATQLELLLRLGLTCCNRHPPARPSIREVVHALSSSSITFSLPTISPPSLSASGPLQPSSNSSILAMEVSAGR